MRRTSLIMMIVVALTVTLLVYARSQMPRSSTQTPQAERQAAQQRQQIALERTITTQQRLNRYFHSDVTPKLKNCWSRVQGKGTIALKYTYTKAGNGRWVFDKLETDNSTLPRGQETVALECMQDAVRGTSFPIEGAESSQNSFVLNWSWPVPFPANAAELTSAMFAARAVSGGGNGGGCDGRGAKAACSNCSSDGRSCLSVCVGFKECTVTTVLCESRIACASGGPFGAAGGGMIAY